MKKIQKKMLTIIDNSPWPTPVDMITSGLNIETHVANRHLRLLQRNGILKSRLSPDDRKKLEWWRPEREHEFRIHLSIDGIGGNQDY